MHIPGTHPPLSNGTIKHERVQGIIQREEARGKVIPEERLRGGRRGRSCDIALECYQILYTICSNLSTWLPSFDIIISSSQDESTSSGTGSGSSAPKAIGIDAVLSKINGPKKFTTIDKTNVDWETFKDKTGMEEELRKKAEGKDAYLVKKDFLNRVDVRRFEQEKDDRNKKRAAAASSSSK